MKRTTLYKIIQEAAFSEMGATIVHRNKRWFSEKAVDKYIEAVIQLNRSLNLSDFYFSYGFIIGRVIQTFLLKHL